MRLEEECRDRLESLKQLWRQRKLGFYTVLHPGYRRRKLRWEQNIRDMTEECDRYREEWKAMM